MDVRTASGAAAPYLIRLHESGVRGLRDEDLSGLLAEILDAALALTSAASATVHLMADSGELQLADSRGTVPDIESTALAEPSACPSRSIPLLSRDGALLGVITAFFPAPGSTSEDQLHLIDLIARHAADFIEHAMARRALHQQCRCEQEARARAEAGLRARDQFIATLSHELRQPLAAALTALEVERRSPSQPRREHAAAVVSDQLRHFARLVEDLADLSRIGRGALQLQRERADLRVIAEQALEMAGPLLRQREQQASLTLGPDAVWVRVDATRIKQVISNLLQNAASYTPPGGQVRVTVSADADRAVLLVRDNGAGIERDALARIFEMFERGSHQATQTGLGIGLAVVRQIIELHGGSVEARSDGPGHGSEFGVVLPLDA